MRQTQDKYEHVRSEQTQSPINEIRVSAKGLDGTYIKRAIELFTGSQDIQKQDTVIIKGIDNAIPKVLVISEIVRRRVAGLSQVNQIGNTQIVDKYVPTEEGLLEVTVTKQLSILTVKLTTNPTEQDKQSVGYQQPLPETEVVPQRQRQQGERNERNTKQRRGGPRGDNRGDNRGENRGQDREQRDNREQRENRGDRGDRGDRAERGDRGDRRDNNRGENRENRGENRGYNRENRDNRGGENRGERNQHRDNRGGDRNTRDNKRPQQQQQQQQ